MIPSSVMRFANEQGYETAEYLCVWNGYKCYEPVFAVGKVSLIGAPLLILEDETGNIRMSTVEEAMQQIAEDREKRK